MKQALLSPFYRFCKEKRKKNNYCAVLKLVLESTVALRHRSGSFWRQGERQSIFRDREGTQLLYQHGGYCVCCCQSRRKRATAFSRTSCSPLPVWRLDGDCPSLLVQKLPLTSPAGAKASQSATGWVALSDLCLEQVTELQPSPYVD